VKLPRDLSGTQLARALSRVGYRITRQTGSHMRLTSDHPSQHHLTVPSHDSLKVATLAAILGDVAGHLQIDRDELVQRLFAPTGRDPNTRG
jgi:predicted RNA binding protein YcfA (HicA-like mRNA interferase family)